MGEVADQPKRGVAVGVSTDSGPLFPQSSSTYLAFAHSRLPQPSSARGSSDRRPPRRPDPHPKQTPRPSDLAPHLPRKPLGSLIPPCALRLRVGMHEKGPDLKLKRAGHVIEYLPSVGLSLRTTPPSLVTHSASLKPPTSEGVPGGSHKNARLSK